MAPQDATMSSRRGLTTRWWIIGIALAVLAVLTVGIVMLASEAVAHNGDTTTLELFGEPAPPTQIDLGDPGPSAGDLLIGVGDFYWDAAHTDLAGSVRFTCVFNVNGVMCTNHLDLDGRGQLVTQQSANPADGPVAIEAVTGGTGDFRNVRGESRAEFQPDGTVNVTFTLQGVGEDD